MKDCLLTIILICTRYCTLIFFINRQIIYMYLIATVFYSTVGGYFFLNFEIQKPSVKVSLRIYRIGNCRNSVEVIINDVS